LEREKSYLSGRLSIPFKAFNVHALREKSYLSGRLSIPFKAFNVHA
jgi:hypothetical protein